MLSKAIAKITGMSRADLFVVVSLQKTWFIFAKSVDNGQFQLVEFSQRAEILHNESFLAFLFNPMAK